MPPQPMEPPPMTKLSNSLAQADKATRRLFDPLVWVGLLAFAILTRMGRTFDQTAERLMREA